MQWQQSPSTATVPDACCQVPQLACAVHKAHLEHIWSDSNPCLWWQTYGHGFGVLRDVAMRLLSIPATSASTERVFSTFKHIWSDHRQSMLMDRMWMSSYIYFNRRALKGTRGQTRSSEEERAEFEEWLQHQPYGISE
ncbi:hypothetical protein QJQ45_006625 [Haematococcus lacustris]|nr:hypothetical protein QJQ45_006625 [Haematococcus lacustris]